MGRIKDKTRYGKDTTPSRTDYWVITDDETGDTKHQDNGELFDMFAEEYEGVGVIMKYADTTNVDNSEDDSGYFTSNDEDLSSVITININKTSISGIDLTSKINTFLSQIGNVNVLIRVEKAGEIDVYGYYLISSYVENTEYFQISCSVFSDLSDGVLEDLSNYYLRFEFSSLTSGGGGINYIDITWAALVALPVGSRGLYYNITDGDPNNNDIIYGEVTLNVSKTTFYYDTTDLILIE